MNNYDAIVVGTGISGGWAAKELCEAGLKTLVLDRGREILHGDYPTAHLEKWDAPLNGNLSLEELKDYPIQRRVSFINHFSKHYFVKDAEHPYHEEYPFTWIRGNHVGGRSLNWARQSYRWSASDFLANERDGVGVDWPIRYEDLAPWYSYVEKFIGVSGHRDGLSEIPDGEFLPPMEMTAIEKHFKKALNSHYTNRHLTIGRSANLTIPHNGRGSCQYRNRCIRGCPYGAYFSSQSSTLPAAKATGNMTLMPHSIVAKVLYDDATQRATGVRVIHAETKEVTEYFAKVVFLNASTIGSTKILLQSKSARFPDGLGNDSGELGHNLMDHHTYIGATATADILLDRYYKGRRPNSTFIAPFKNIESGPQSDQFIRSYSFKVYTSRKHWLRYIPGLEYGAQFKEACMEPGNWEIRLMGYGETLPDHHNHMYLHPDKVDAYGLPQAAFKVQWNQNEYMMREDIKNEATVMLEQAGYNQVVVRDDGKNPGSSIHEMGTARMGNNPETSVLNKWNQVHAVPNVFVTDGACMTSSGNKAPSLTYMALTVRAANYAISHLKKGTM